MSDIWSLVRESVSQITPYSPGKSSKEVMEELGIEDVTKLASNENPLGTSPRAIEAMQKVLQDVYIYPDPTWADLRRALGEFYDVDPEGIIIGRGSDEIIHMMGLSFVNPGEEVIYSLPAFALYPFTTTLMAGVHRCIPSVDHEHDIRAIAAAITDKTKLIFLANPCNPTGTVIAADDIAWLMDQVPDHCIVAFDEAYYEYVDDPAYPDTLQYARAGRHCVSLRTFSKAYGLAGLRVGYGIAHPEVAKAIRLSCEPFNVGLLSLAAAEAALGDREHVDRSVAMNKAGKAFLYSEFERLGLQYLPTQANFIFVDTGIDSRACFDRLMRQGVTVRTGDIFGYATWIRVTIGTREQNERFIAALEKAIAEG